MRIVECATRRDELRAAARWVRESIADSGGALRFRDFAVILRDVEPLAPLVAEVFSEYELPYFVDRRRPLRGHPLSRLVPGLLEAVQSDLDVGPMVRLLRTRLLPLSVDEAERLENVLTRERVRGTAAWRQPSGVGGEGARAYAELAPQRTEVVAGLEPIGACVRGRRSATGAEWAAALFAALERLRVPLRLESWIAEAQRQCRWEAAETHRLAWEALCDVIEEVHAVLGGVPLTADDLAAVLRSTLGDLTLGLAPPALDQVLVSGIERSRHPDVRRVWVAGMNEGVFPARPAEDRLLSTADRAALAAAGLAAPSSHQGDALGERLLAYIAFTRPSERLVISYATVADDGGEVLPSPLLEDVRRALPGVRVERPDANTPPVHVAELARGYLACRAHERRGYERLAAELRQDAGQAARLERLLRGLSYANSCAAVPRRALPGGLAWEGSPSELETFIRCPFKHFANYRLRLDPQAGPRPVRWDLGATAHEILAHTTRRAMREPGGIRAVTTERWLMLLDEAVAAVRAGRPADEAQRRPDLAFLGDVLNGFLRDVVTVHAARLRRGQFVPQACEQAFGGRTGGLPGLELPLGSAGRVRLRGIIDRIDVGLDEAGRRLLLVYDYKSSAEAMGGNVLTGHRLQLFLYLLALEQAWSAQPEPAQPAGVFLAPLFPDLKVMDRKYVAEAGPEEQLMFLYRPRGLVEEHAARLLDAQLGTRPSPVAALQLKKSGEFYANSDACGAETLVARLAQARETLLQAAQGIASGCVDIAPLVERRTLACRVCEFRPVCRFERAYNRPRAAEAVLPRLPGVAGEEPEEVEES